ncbi:MAG: hypothetical protein ACTH31_11300 [Pseudoclavibacter sp.]
MARAHWHEYPLGPGGRIAASFAETAIGFGAGLVAGLFLLLFLVGLPNEYGVVSAILAGLGMPADDVRVITHGIDLLGRAAVGVLMVLLVVTAYCGTWATLVRDVSVSRSVAEAARSGASRRAVPSPAQVARLVREGMQPFEVILMLTVILSGFFVVFMAIFAIVEGFLEGLVVAGIGLAIDVALLAWWRRIRTRVRPELAERRALIASHWTTEHEEAAWAEAREHGEPKTSGRRRRKERHHGVRVARALALLGGILFLVAPPVFYGIVFTMHPDAHRYGPGGWELGPSAVLSEDAERGVIVAMIVLAGIVGGAVATTAASLVFEMRGRRAERADLLRALDDPAASRPAAGVLQEHSEPQAAPAAFLIAAFAGCGISLAPAAMLLSVMDTDGYYREAGAIFGGWGSWGAGATVAFLLLAYCALRINAAELERGRELRNRLRHRWPILPTVKKISQGEGKKAKVVPATVGPALTPMAEPDAADQGGGVG